MTRKYHETCGFPVDSMYHLRACVPKRRWPEDVKEAQKAGHLAAAPMSTGYACSCGYVGVSAGALNLHRLRSKVHKEAVNG